MLHFFVPVYYMSTTMEWVMWIKLTISVSNNAFITGYGTESGGGQYSSGYMNSLSPIFMSCIVNSMKGMEGNI